MDMTNCGTCKGEGRVNTAFTFIGGEWTPTAKAGCKSCKGSGLTERFFVPLHSHKYAVKTAPSFSKGKCTQAGCIASWEADTSG